jgi:hypothetical protein
MCGHRREADHLLALIASFQQLHRQRGVSWLAPPIALSAADQSLAVMVDGNQWAMAVGQCFN